MATEPEQVLDVEVRPDGVAVVALDRPHVLNALKASLIAELLSTLGRLKADTAVRVLVLTGRGRAFCAGADLQDKSSGLHEDAATRSQRFLARCDKGIHALARAMATFGKPTIVAVNGPAVGGGASLALSADIVIAGRSAYFMQPFVTQLGLGPDMGGSWQLMRRAGPARAMGALLLGEKIDAERAERWGLVWQGVDDAELLPTALSIAERLANGPSEALARVSQLMRGALLTDLDVQLDRERDLQAHLLGSDDFAEALTAFLEKRKPNFHRPQD